MKCMRWLLFTTLPYTRTHQVVARVKGFSGGLEIAHRLSKANLITKMDLVPEDKPEDWDRPNGLRLGTIEVTRLGMNEDGMETITDLIAHVLEKNEDPKLVGKEVEGFRHPFQTLYYCFDNGYPA